MAVVNSADINTLEQVSLGFPGFKSFGYIPVSESAGSCNKSASS